ncbi:uncharacterized protein LOC129589889 [Paramacrobiotus metropolitanus]|uniref:uncharacterized protein LOC129589889 n=1 Tax=Paramacrobiotus metropolitanus TaxID=2943436 RepID=UPI0024460E51|nr:uncharacterized protein LOC129589889 [Paramacrobiotus metropolitanus]
MAQNIDQRRAAVIQLLNSEIDAFYASIHSHGALAVQREASIARLTSFITSRHPHTRVEPFGSSLTSTFLRFSDIDLLVTVRHRRPDDPHAHSQAWLNSLRKEMSAGRSIPGYDTGSGFSARWIKDAAVPYLKVTEYESQVSFVITCTTQHNCHQGLLNSQWINE